MSHDGSDISDEDAVLPAVGLLDDLDSDVDFSDEDDPRPPPRRSRRRRSGARPWRATKPSWQASSSRARGSPFEFRADATPDSPFGPGYYKTAERALEVVQASPWPAAVGGQLRIGLYKFAK